MYYPTQTFLVAGLSRSGIAAAEYLVSEGATVFLYDDVDDEGVRMATENLSARGCVRLTKEEVRARADACDVLVLSPGIPVDHPLPVFFRKAGKAIVGEAELGARALRAASVGVTGTNGKTTTVYLLEHMFRTAGKRALACGNTGTPITACLNELGKDDVAIAEISSFQLETLSSFRPHVAVVLNLAEDHLNRHYTMENYIFLKLRLLKNSAESEYAVLNYDDPIVRSFSEKTKAKTVWFSLEERVEGAYLREDSLYFGEERLCAASEIALEGKHNLANALAAVCAAKLMGVRSEAVVDALKSFQGVRHRIRKIGEVGGVTFIDDSKATNVDATLKAIASVKGESVLLLGGKDKGYSYEPVFRAIGSSGIVHVVIYGENAFRVLNAAVGCGFTRLTLCRPFDMAVRIAYMMASPGQNVLLSPASASFDEFRSYEARGERFAELMRLFMEERKAEGSVEERSD